MATIEAMGGAVARPQPTKGAIESWLVAKLAEQLDLDPREISADETFDSYGIGSTEAVIISGDLEVWLDQQLSATLLWDYPSIAILAVYLAGGQEA